MLRRSPTNCYNVPKRAWTRWSRAARAVFNETYKAAALSWDLLAPPSLQKARPRARKILAWNAAWIAADAAHRVHRTA